MKTVDAMRQRQRDIKPREPDDDEPVTFPVSNDDEPDDTPKAGNLEGKRNRPVPAKKITKEIRRLEDLVPHPFQANFFDNLSDFDLNILAEDIRRNGLREEIEILPENRAGLPANSIISGHQRLRALRLLGRTKTAIVVRYDLASADAATIERALLESNQHRRHLDSMAKARIALRLYEIEKGRVCNNLEGQEQEDARDRVGKTENLSGRHLSRLFRVPDSHRADRRSRNVVCCRANAPEERRSRAGTGRRHLDRPESQRDRRDLRTPVNEGHRWSVSARAHARCANPKASAVSSSQVSRWSGAHAAYRLRHAESAHRKFINSMKMLTTLRALLPEGLAPTKRLRIFDGDKREAV